MKQTKNMAAEPLLKRVDSLTDDDANMNQLYSEWNLRELALPALSDVPRDRDALLAALTSGPNFHKDKLVDWMKSRHYTNFADEFRERELLLRELLWKRNIVIDMPTERLRENAKKSYARFMETNIMELRQSPTTAHEIRNVQALSTNPYIVYVASILLRISKQFADIMSEEERAHYNIHDDESAHWNIREKAPEPRWPDWTIDWGAPFSEFKNLMPNAKVQSIPQSHKRSSVLAQLPTEL